LILKTFTTRGRSYPKWKVNRAVIDITSCSLPFKGRVPLHNSLPFKGRVREGMG